MQDRPLVSCIMPTRDRRELVPVALDTFLRQDYERRELLIVDDGSDPIEDLLPDDPRIRYERLPRRLRLGAKRNLACRLAGGDVIAHWDDDDWSASWRLTYQVTQLIETGADVCGLSEVLFFDPRTRRAWRYVYPAGGRSPWVAGGTLCYTKSFWQGHSFAELNVGEDTRFVRDGRPQIAVLADPSFYVATIHPRNTSPKHPTGSRWQRADAEAVVRLVAGDGVGDPPRPVTAPPSQTPAGRVRLTAIVHMAVPAHGAGAEWYLHDLFAWLTARGHETTVYAAQASGEWELDGVPYVGGRLPQPSELAAVDVLVTHLDLTRQAVQLAHVARKPLVHLVHNDVQLRHARVRRSDAALVVFNSRWISKAVRWQGPHVVVPPPVFATRYAGPREGDAITLLNLWEPKGGPLLFELAAMLPDRPFIGVRGAYGHQEVPPRAPVNVEVLENQADVRAVYRRTRLLLMPSSYESWGRCAVEAAASGIPTLAHPTPGLLESVGPCAIFCDRADAAAWVRAIRELDDPQEYERASGRALRRAAELDPTPHLEVLEQALQDVAGRAASLRTRRRVVSLGA